MEWIIEVLRTVALVYTNGYNAHLIDIPGLIDGKINIIAQTFLSMIGSG